MTDSATILIVDDVPENLALLETIISSRGHFVRVAPNGSLALRSIRSSLPDLILLDVNMPGVDGWEVCRQLKANSVTADIPVIFLTARSAAVDRVEGFRAGAADYVTKPFSAEEVCARIETHLALQRARLELEREKRVIEDHVRELERLKEAREELANMIVHDMRTPLSAMRLLIEGLEFAEEPEEIPEITDELRISAARLERMVEDVLDVSMMEHGEAKLKIEPCDLNQFAERAARTAMRIGQASTIHVEVPPRTTVCADPTMLERVLENLLVNAIKHSPPATRVVIRAVHGPDSTLVEIIDQGPGIAPDALTQIFGKYHHEGHNGRSWGLGLTFCKLAIDAHEGAIGVENIDGGARFWFELNHRARALNKAAC